MTKYAALLAVLITLALPAKAHAQACFPFGCGPLGAGGASMSVAFGAGMTAFTALPILIIEGVDPWTGNFPVVQYKYPGDKETVGVKTDFVSHTPYHVVVDGHDTIRSDG